MPLGIYISVPFCRTKCSFCNFASGVSSRAAFEGYVDRVCADIARAEQTAHEMGGQLERSVDSIYLGGGTPSVLETGQLERIFAAVRGKFQVQTDAEITVECAPGTLTDDMIAALVRCGVNRVSLGVQSFVDRESSSVGRLHTRAIVLDDLARLRASGIANINIDLIAGLPHQTAESWEFSLSEVIAAGAPHASVYMLEVDEDSRLGRELIAGGARYHAHHVPDDALTADLYEAACERLNDAGIMQYEISNFARAGYESRHNLKYWTRQSYLGFGVDAHSMLHTADMEAVRFSTADTLERYLTCETPQRTAVTQENALEESFFLGLRLNRGVDVREIEKAFGNSVMPSLQPVCEELVSEGLLTRDENTIALTARGRLFSNEVFERFLSSPAANDSVITIS